MVKKHTEEVKKQISKSMKKYWMINKHPRKGKTPWNKGLKGSQKAWNKGKQNPKSMTGSNHWNWKGGKTSENEKIRKTVEYKKWRLAVYERDGWKCVCCGNVGGNLTAHHIKSYRNFPKLIFEINNGVTLCKECHTKTNNYAEKAIQNPNA